MKPFDIQDTAMILIDHQVGTNTWAKSTPLELLQRNVVILAKFAKGTGMPLVLTSSQETNTHIQGPLMPELEAIAPNEFAARIKRKGLVNAWEDEDFAKACRATGKRNFVMAGVTTDVCMVAPAISAVEEGFNVQVVCDACGSGNQIAALRPVACARPWRATGRYRTTLNKCGRRSMAGPRCSDVRPHIAATYPVDIGIRDRHDARNLRSSPTSSAARVSAGLLRA